MTVKTTGAEIKRFYHDKDFWPDDNGDTYHDDEEIFVDGTSLDIEKSILDIPDSAVVRIRGGIVFGPMWDSNEPTFEAYFKQWKKRQTTVTLLIECDVTAADVVAAAIKVAGGKVVV